jgi:hypothetical protein
MCTEFPKSIVHLLTMYIETVTNVIAPSKLVTSQVFLESFRINFVYVYYFGSVFYMSVPVNIP